MRFRLRECSFRLHPLTLIFALLAWRFGLSEELAAALISLGVHELTHLLAARLLGVRVLRIDLMPFGGAAYLGNPYALNPLRLCGVALAGPGGNLLLMLACAAMGWAGWLDMRWAALLVRTNLLLMLFNLLPALPLDGGRVLYVLLERKLGERRALEVGVWAGRVLALALAVCAIVGYVHGQALNLSMLIAAAFIAAAGSSERKACQEGKASAISSAMHVKKEPHRLVLMGMDEECTPIEAARTLRCGEERLYAICSQGKLRDFMTQEQLLARLAEGGGLARERG